VRLALAQYALDPEMSANLTKALELMETASRQRAELVLFPELCLSPFFPQFAGQKVSHYALTLDDERIQQFQTACLRLKLAASPNVYLQEEHGRFDASLLIDARGEIRGVSKMVHIAQLPGFYEKDYYTPSDTGFRVYDTPRAKIGVVVCFDRHFPESVRACALQGAELILIPTANTLAEPRELFECELRAAAMQNGLFVAMCNRVGAERDAVFCGESTIVDPHGEVIAKARQTESLLIADLDLSQVQTARRKRPYLSLRRPQFYQ
jgi:predicted amidohydrolase